MLFYQWGGLAGQPGQSGRTSQMLCVDAGAALALVAAAGNIAAAISSWAAMIRLVCIRVCFMR